MNSKSDVKSCWTTQLNSRSIYDNPSDIDLFPAGLAEDRVPGAVVGRTFATIIGRQFKALKEGDRLQTEHGFGIFFRHQ